MKKTPNCLFSRTHLECLSTGELIKLAEDLGLYIPAGLERIFIIEELLLENADNEEPETEENIEIDTAFPEPVGLPKHYNFSFIDVMVRDPLWVYVFWEVKVQDKEIYEKAEDFSGYCLRIIPLDEGETIPKSKDNSFVLPVDADDNARYLCFDEYSSKDQNHYIIKLGLIRGETELQIAVSAPFNLPRLIGNENIDVEQNPLVRLSGMQDFSTIKNIDRLVRVKRL